MPAFMPTFSQLLRYIYIMLAGVVWQSTAAEYDAGVSNVTQNGQRSFVFNQVGQLASSGEISFRYDGYNRRIKKSGRSTSYSIDNQSGTLLLTNGSQHIRRYIYLGSQLIARIGNVAAIKDKPSYTGHLEDADLSLTYMQQRYYDPVVGRFYSNDPVGFTGEPETFNRYSYANNNPYKYTDPDGRVAVLARMMMPPPVVPKSSSLPNIPGHPGVSSGSWSSPTVPNIPINASSPLTTIVVLIAKAASAGSDSSTEQKGQGQPEVGECPECGGKTSDKEGKIAKDQGMSVSEVKGAIHGAKNAENLPNNSNVEVCKDCGEIFPQGSDGTLGDSIGNIKDKQ